MVIFDCLAYTNGISAEPPHVGAHVDAFHRSLRHFNRRMVRATCAFSKTKAGLEGGLAITLAYWNFCLTTQARKLTPAMELGILDEMMSPEDLLDGVRQLGS